MFIAVRLWQTVRSAFRGSIGVQPFHAYGSPPDFVTILRHQDFQSWQVPGPKERGTSTVATPDHTNFKKLCKQKQ